MPLSETSICDHSLEIIASNEASFKTLYKLNLNKCHKLTSNGIMIFF